MLSCAAEMTSGPPDAASMPREAGSARITYSTEFLLSVGGSDHCKKLPVGIDASVLSELLGRSDAAGAYSRTGRWDARSSGSSDHEGDLPERESNQPDKCSGNQYRHNWQNTEHDGLLGSGAFPRPLGYARPLASNDRGSGYQLSRNSGRYQPPRPYKAVPVSRKDIDSINDETFGSFECSSDDIVEAERKRRASFELMRKEQHKAMQETKIAPDSEKENIGDDTISLLQNSAEKRGPPTKSDKQDELKVSSLCKEDAIKTSALLPTPTTRPLKPPGFANALPEKRLQLQSSNTSLNSENKSLWAHNATREEKNSEVMCLGGPKEGNQSAKSISTSKNEQKGIPDSIGTIGQKHEHPSSSQGGVTSVEYASGVLNTSKDWDNDAMDNCSIEKEGKSTNKTSCRQDNSVSILDKFFGNALSKSSGNSPSYIESQQLNTDILVSSVPESSKYAQWFPDEGSGHAEYLSSKSPLSMIVKDENLFAENMVRDPSASDDTFENKSPRSPSYCDAGSKLHFISPTPAVGILKEYSTSTDDITESVPVMTCEDLEQTMLAHVANTSSSNQQNTVQEHRAEQIAVDQHASHHLLSLLQKGTNRKGSSPLEFHMGPADELLSSDPNCMVNGGKTATTPVNNAEAIPTSVKNVTLEALFGAAFMNDLHSRDSPVSVREHTADGPNSSSKRLLFSEEGKTIPSFIAEDHHLGEQMVPFSHSKGRAFRMKPGTGEEYGNPEFPGSSREGAAAWEKAEAKEERIMVSVRLRPLNGREAFDSSDWECISPTTIMFRSTVPERAMFPTAYTYDRVFGPNCSTRQVYEEGAKEVALLVVSGINSSIFAYGQTSSGKTYTMTGITEYSVLDIYDYIEKHPERKFILKFSAIEIYNEAVRDLLSHDTTPLRLLDDPEKGTTVEKLTEETLRDKDHLRDLLAVCEAQRQIGETALNETSSRSHQILRLTIESSAIQYLGRGNSSTLVACVNFVDLAGSERASQTASAGVRLKEGSHINRSLLTLGKVIRQLSKGRNGHIPYRDSKLTRILQSSLGGNARTAIICTMSPAHSHIEQSRNTLLFATCAKEVVTNAQVNMVMSDKTLVKHLQRELARLENELKFPGSAACTTHAEVLREKDAQIKKLEKQLKELMEERDTVQSHLKCLLKGDGDDHGNDRTAKRWDEHSRSSESLAQNASEEALSVSDTYGVAYQDQDHAVFDGSYVFSADHDDSAFPDQIMELPQQTRDQKLISPWRPPSNHSSDGIESYHMKEAAFRTASEVSEEHCREVQCIDIHEHRRSTSHEFNLLLPEGTKLQTPEVEEISKDAVPQPYEEQELESITKKMEDPIRMYPGKDKQQAEIITKTMEGSVEVHECESNGITDNVVKLFTCDSNVSFEIGKPYPHECLTVKRCIMSSKDSALARSKSCRANFMIIPNSWFDDSENTSRTPPDEIFRHAPRRPDKVRRSLYPENGDCQNEDISVDCSVVSGEVVSDEVVKDMGTGDEVAKDMSTSDAEQETLVNDISCVTGLEEKTENHHEDQLEDYQAQQAVRDDSTVAKTVKDVGIDSALSTIESPSRWPIDFEKKQLEIIELWHECNVSIVHRTCFFVLFKGDPADNIYMEVEHRRLPFIKSSFSARPAVEGELNSAITSSLKNLRRERDMLYKQMLKKLTNGEKESIYTRWGIDLSTKQRRLQLSRLMWTQTDMEHIRESASLVAKLIDLLEPGQALKEMFGLNFSLAPRVER